MKWGIRRYQNPDGTLTKEGRKKARQEYRADNKEAFEKGQKATITDIAKRLAEKDYAKAMTKWEKDTSNEKNKKNLELAGNVYKALTKTSKNAFTDMEKHRNTLIKKYGKEAVSDIQYDKKGRLNERTQKGSDVILAIFASGVMGAGAAMVGSPIIPVFTPQSGYEQGRQLYNQTVIAEKLLNK